MDDRFYATNLAFVGIDLFAANFIPVVATAQDPESLRDLFGGLGCGRDLDSLL